MQKAQFVEIIKSRLGWKWGDRSIALHIDVAWNQVVGQLFASDSHQLDLYTKTYTVDVTNGSPRKYALLPVGTIQYKDAAGGVRRVHTQCDEEVHFVPMRGIDFQIFKSLDAGLVATDIIGYLPKTDRIEFFEISDDITNVRMEVVPTFSEFDDTDDIPIPDGMAENIYGLVLQAVQGNAPTDTNIFKSQVQITDNQDL